MLKITLKVQQKQDSDDCTVTVEMPKSMDKASSPEKNITAVVYNAINEALKNLK